MGVEVTTPTGKWGGLVTWLHVRGSAVAVFDIESGKYNVPVGLGIKAGGRS